VSDSHLATLTTLCRRLGLDWAQMHDLPLQEDLARFDADPHVFGERVRSVVPLNHFAATQKDGGFLHSGAALICGELTLSSTIHMALDIELGEHLFATLAIPYAGLTSIRIDRQELPMRAGATVPRQAPCPPDNFIVGEQARVGQLDQRLLAEQDLLLR
jgi:hypothetical protein